jgi:DMSO reductase family type II enzyme chaperone
MFVYSLAGLDIEGETIQDMELPDNEITARLGVYQALARLIAFPDADSHEAAAAGGWPERLAHDAKLLAFPFDFGSASIDASVTAEDFQAEYLRLFEIGNGSGTAASLHGGAYTGDRAKRLEEVVRFYEYFGLKASAEDPRPADHLATELEFMKFLTLKEATSASPRLQASFRRAQQDFLERQLLPWLPELVRRTAALSPMPFWGWAVTTAAGFVRADAAALGAPVS